MESSFLSLASLLALIPKGEFDDKINQFIERVIVDPARFDEVLKAVQTVWEQRQVRVQDEGELHDKKRGELEAQMRVIVDKMRLVSSPTAIKYMEEDLTKIEQQINDLDARKGELETQGGVDMPTILKYIE